MRSKVILRCMPRLMAWFYLPLWWIFLSCG